MAKKYYVQVCIPAGTPFDKSAYFDTYAEADAKVEELHEVVDKLAGVTNKSYTILIHSEDVHENCPTCGVLMHREEDQDNLIVNEDYSEHLEVCALCIESYYQEEQRARIAAARRVREDWFNKAPVEARKQRG